MPPKPTASVIAFPAPAPTPKADARKAKVKANIKSAAARAKLPPGRTTFDLLAGGIALAYYRPTASTKAGSWVARVKQEGDPPYRFPVLADADDIEPANGTTVLSYRQALTAALDPAFQQREAPPPAPTAPGAGTLGEAVDRYVERLNKRGGRAGREAKTGIVKHCGDLLKRTISSLTADDMTALVEVVPQRVRSNLKAALNQLPASVRPALATTRALNGADARTNSAGVEIRRVGVEDVPDEAAVRAIVTAAREHDDQFGLLVAVLASTGSRPGQIVRCRVRDVDGDVLVVPPSAKGKSGSRKAWARRPLPPSLAAELRASSQGRPAEALLFWLPRHERDTTPRDQGGTGWRLVGERPWHRVAWARAAREAGIENGVYRLRHSCAVRMIVGGLPLRVIAAAMDTSTHMLEAVYSRWLGSHAEHLLKADVASLDL